MTIHVKTTLILLGTLAIGVICGGLIIGAVSRSSMRAAMPFGGAGFVNRWVEILDPDVEHKQAVEQIIERHAPRSGEQSHACQPLHQMRNCKQEIFSIRPLSGLMEQ
jgi:hypothetical protein